MKLFKEIDFWISVGLIIAYSIIFLMEGKKPSLNNYYLIQGYIVVGMWQTTSMIIHILLRKNFPISYVRKLYTWLTAVCLITMPMGLLMLAILLFMAPFMAIFYACLCGYELFKIKKYETV